MFRIFITCLALSPAYAGAADIVHRFLHISHPFDELRFAVGSDVAGMGYFYFPDQKWTPGDLRIRIRIYKPVQDDFEVLQEHDAEIGTPLANEPESLQFAATIKLKKAPKPGKYLYRVDCLEKSDKEEKLLASQSLFITFVDRPDKRSGVQAARPRHSRTQSVSRTSRRLVVPSSDATWRSISDRR